MLEYVRAAEATIRALRSCLASCSGSTVMQRGAASTPCCCRQQHDKIGVMLLQSSIQPACLLTRLWGMLADAACYHRPLSGCIWFNHSCSVLACSVATPPHLLPFATFAAPLLQCTASFTTVQTAAAYQQAGDLKSNMCNRQE